MRSAAVLAIAALALPGFAAASGVAVTLAPAQILVGDRVTADLSVPVAEGAGDPTFPDWSRGWGEAEVLEAGPVVFEGAGASRVAVQRLTLTAFKPGKVALPPVAVRFGASSAATPPALALEVRSVLAADDTELAPAPPAPPRPQPVPRAVWIALAAGLVLAAAAALLAFRRKYGAAPLAAPALPPFAELERALGLLGDRSPAETFRGLSRAFRRYLGRAFDFHALESTTTEVQRRLGERGVARDLVQRSAGTLRLADQVKFAARPAGADEAARKVAEARTLATELEILLAPPPPLSPASAGPQETVA